MCEQCRSNQTPAKPARVRTKLWELHPRFHCPVLGTCLSIDELNKVMRQSGASLKSRVTDYELHVTLVTQAQERSLVTKNLQKTLDRKYQRWIKRISPCRSHEELNQHWRQAKSEGDIAGAFWATLTHPEAKADSMQLVYEDVHMLSHIQGASNRADLAKLNSLEKELAELKESANKARVQQQEQLQQRDHRIENLEGDLAKANAERQRCELEQREPVEQPNCNQNQSLARQLSWSKIQLKERDSQLSTLRKQVVKLNEMLNETESAKVAVELALAQLLEGKRDDDKESGAFELDGKKVVYIGGRPTITPHLRSLVEAHNGEFTYHDGGVEDSRAGLNCALAGADMVFCPVDCISHDACLKVKRHCQQKSKPFIPLRSSGLSAFAAGLLQIGTDPKCPIVNTANLKAEDGVPA